MTPAPDGRGPEPLRDQVFIAVIYAFIGAAMFVWALAPVSDDLGPTQALALSVPLTPLCLAAIRWRAHRTAANRAAAQPESRRGATTSTPRDPDEHAVRRR